jgi:hypothetical protein
LLGPTAAAAQAKNNNNNDYYFDHGRPPADRTTKKHNRPVVSSIFGVRTEWMGYENNSIIVAVVVF